jgi:cytochrome c553
MMKFSSLILLASLAFASAGHAQDTKGDAQAGEKKVAMCVGCHGIKGYQASFPVVYKVPKIAGQSMTYIQSALAAYKKGERRNATMRAIAGSLSEKDMADVAAYYSTLGHDDSAVIPAKVNDAQGHQRCMHLLSWREFELTHCAQLPQNCWSIFRLLVGRFALLQS